MKVLVLDICGHTRRGLERTLFLSFTMDNQIECQTVHFIRVKKYGLAHRNVLSMMTMQNMLKKGHFG